MKSTNRWHKSHRSVKIPNVKLRPPPRSTEDVADDGAADDAHYRRTRAQNRAGPRAHSHADFVGTLPLEHVVLSFTGIPDKKELVDIAQRLGARVCGDLTVDVTHLIAVCAGSDKYRAAVQFHMQVVRPEWLYGVREAWLAGEDSVDLVSLGEMHRLLPFEGLVLALTGFGQEERDVLASRIEAMGGNVAPKLVWDGTITHLVCAPPTRPRKGYVRVMSHRALASECDMPNVRNAAAIKLVHAEWVDDCEAARVLLPESNYDATKGLEGGNERAQRVAHYMPRTLVRTQSGPQRTAEKEAPPLPPSQPVRTSLLAFSRSASFEAPQRTGVFANLAFHVDMADDARTRRVIQVLRHAGGRIQDSRDSHVDYVVCPLQCTPQEGLLVTHHWVERCLYDDALVDPSVHPAYRPASRPLPLPDAKAWCIAITGMDRYAPAYHHTCAVIEALGGRTSASFSRHTSTHLLCATKEPNVKARKAEEWHIPLITLDFLEQALRPAHGASEAPSAPSTLRRRRQRPTHQVQTSAPTAEPEPLTDPVCIPTETHESHIVYDDPAARREQTKLLALIDPERKKRRVSSA